MKYSVYVTKHFIRQLKKIKKKFPNIKKDILKILKTFSPENEVHIGKSIFKIRIKSSDTNQGKSGGLRSYIYLFRKKKLLIPIYIYTKSEKESLSENELDYHFGKILEEILEKL